MTYRFLLKLCWTVLLAFILAAVHFVVAFSVGYALTGSLAVSGAIALIEPSLNTVAYFFHEKAWERIRAPRLGLEPA